MKRPQKSAENDPVNWLARLEALEPVEDALRVPCSKCGDELLCFNLNIGDGSILDGVVYGGVITVGRHCSMDDWDRKVFCDRCIRRGLCPSDGELPCVEETD